MHITTLTMKFSKITRLPKFSRILLVVALSGFAFCAVSRIISMNLIQYSNIPQFVYIKTGSSAKKNQYYKVPAQSKIPIDNNDSISKISLSEISDKSHQHFVDDILYHENPTFLVWTILISIAVALVVGAFPVYLMKMLELRNKFTLSTRQMRLSLWYAGVLVLILVGSNKLPGIYPPENIIDNFNILLSNGWIIIRCIVSVMILFLIPAFSVIFLIGLASDEIRAEKPEMVHIEHAVKKLKSLNNVLQGTLQFLSLIIVFSVLTSTTLGASINATLSIKGFDLYPHEMSYVYGLYFTVFLCIIYVPVYYQIRHNYNLLKELAIEMDLDDNPEHKDVYKSVFGDVKFEGSMMDNIKLGITILAPLVTSLLPDGMKWL